MHINNHKSIKNYNQNGNDKTYTNIIREKQWMAGLN